MRKKTSTAEKVRRMIDQGHTNRAIIDKLGVKPQVVYNMRYQMNKARGLGAIGTPAPIPADGIGTPPKRKYTRRVPAGTGITAAEPEPAANVVPIKRPLPGEWTELPVTMIEPKPTLWQRIVRFFKGN